jgi:hypothetical protein
MAHDLIQWVSHWQRWIVSFSYPHHIESSLTQRTVTQQSLPMPSYSWQSYTQTVSPVLYTPASVMLS